MKKTKSRPYNKERDGIMRRLQKLSLQIQVGSYWLHSRPGVWDRYIHYLGPVHVSTGEHESYLQGRSRATFVDLRADTIHRSIGGGYSWGTGITWKKTTQTRFDFWYNMAGGSSEKS